VSASTIVLIGNLTADPEAGKTHSGTAVTSLRIASTERYVDRHTGQWTDGDTTHVRAVCWRNLATNVAKSLRKGDRVVVTGRLREREIMPKDGDERITYEIDVEDIGASLTFATVEVHKATAARR
jgi:single-strand DNA-binding protein